MSERAPATVRVVDPPSGDYLVVQVFNVDGILIEQTPIGRTAIPEDIQFMLTAQAKAVADNPKLSELLYNASRVVPGLKGD